MINVSVHIDTMPRFVQIHLCIMPTDIFAQILYYNGRREVSKWRARKKGGNEDKTLKTLIFVTAILNLIKALVDLVKSLTG